MSSGNSTLDNVVWVAMAGGVFGLLGLCVRAITRSNCKEFSLCYGLVACSRHNIPTAINAAHSHNNASPNHTIVPVYQDKHMKHQQTMTDDIDINMNFNENDNDNERSPTSVTSHCQTGSTDSFNDEMCCINALNTGMKSSRLESSKSSESINSYI